MPKGTSPLAIRIMCSVAAFEPLASYPSARDSFAKLVLLEADDALQHREEHFEVLAVTTTLTTQRL